MDEVAQLLDVHKNTVRAWIKAGLQVVDERRPTLILGRQLIAFANERRRRVKCSCRPGQLYCVRCRAAREPSERSVEYAPMTSGSGNLRGVCPQCGTLMFRRVSLRKLLDAAGELAVSFPLGEQRITDRACPSSNCDLDEVA
jgi:hypothetical protein